MKEKYPVSTTGFTNEDGDTKAVWILVPSNVLWQLWRWRRLTLCVRCFAIDNHLMRIRVKSLQLQSSPRANPCTPTSASFRTDQPVISSWATQIFATKGGATLNNHHHLVSVRRQTVHSINATTIILVWVRHCCLASLIVVSRDQSKSGVQWSHQTNQPNECFSRSVLLLTPDKYQPSIPELYVLQQLRS